jgi:hypothetical protein
MLHFFFYKYSYWITFKGRRRVRDRLAIGFLRLHMPDEDNTTFNKPWQCGIHDYCADDVFVKTVCVGNGYDV